MSFQNVSIGILFTKNVFYLVDASCPFLKIYLIQTHGGCTNLWSETIYFLENSGLEPEATTGTDFLKSHKAEKQF